MVKKLVLSPINQKSHRNILNPNAPKHPLVSLMRNSRLKVAEKGGSRTHQGRLTPLTSFEDWAPHRGAILIRADIIGNLTE